MNLRKSLWKTQWKGKERGRDPALRILNHCRTSVSLHCADFIDYFTVGNIVNLFIPHRRPSARWPHWAPVAPIMRVEKYCLLVYSSLNMTAAFRVIPFRRFFANRPCLINCTACVWTIKYYYYYFFLRVFCFPRNCSYHWGYHSDHILCNF